MTAELIAEYVYQIGVNQRKVDYCKQIIASNPYFIVSKLFSINFNHSKHSLNAKEFTSMAESIGFKGSQEENGLLFAYFRLDGKEYVTCEEFCQALSPQGDAALIKLVQNRNPLDFKMDYSLKYAFQKYFTQVVQGQKILEQKSKFDLQTNLQEQNYRRNRLDANTIKQFLKVHCLYPSDSVLQFIVKEIGKNKGLTKRNRLICQFIQDFVKEKNTRREYEPKLVSKASGKPISMPLTRCQNSQLKQKKNIKKEIQSIKLTKKSSSEIDWNSFSPTKKRKQVSSISPQQSLKEVENRINLLMNEVKAEQQLLFQKSRLSSRSVLTVRQSNHDSSHLEAQQKGIKKNEKILRDKTFEAKKSFDYSSKGSPIDMAFSSISIPFTKMSLQNSDARSAKSSRDQIRKKYKLNSFSPLKVKKLPKETEFDRIPEQSKQYCESSREHPIEKVVPQMQEKKGVSKNSRYKVDLQRYNKYNYIPQSKSKVNENMKERISYLKKLVSDRP